MPLGLAGFLTLTFAFVLVMELRYPQWTDREYAARRTLIQKRVEEQPDRPVCAVLGSSRVGTGFLPEEMDPLYDQEGLQVTVFNFSHTGSGPRLNLVQVQRLLDDGVKPKWILFEQSTPFLHFERVIFADFSFRDVKTLMPYIEENRYIRQPIIYRFEAVNRYRHGPLKEFAPEFTSGKGVTLRPYGGDDGWERPQNLTEAKLANLQETIRSQYQHVMAGWRVDPNLDEVLSNAKALSGQGHSAGHHSLPGIFDLPRLVRPGVRTGFKLLPRASRDLCILISTCRAMPDNMFIDPHHLNEEVR